jgi:hypothetical protein
MIITRHGGSSHYMRPDAVYKTSVLRSMTGYVPQQDVMNVAMDFTQGPYLFMQGQMPATGMGVAGLGRAPLQLMGMWPPSSWGWLNNLRMRWAAWKAERAAAKAGLHGLIPYGPKAWAGPQVVALPGQRMTMLTQMAQKDMSPSFADQNTAAIMQRWNYLRAPTR